VKRVPERNPRTRAPIDFFFDPASAGRSPRPPARRAHESCRWRSEPPGRASHRNPSPISSLLHFPPDFSPMPKACRNVAGGEASPRAQPPDQSPQRLLPRSCQCSTKSVPPAPSRRPTAPPPPPRPEGARKLPVAQRAPQASQPPESKPYPFLPLLFSPCLPALSLMPKACRNVAGGKASRERHPRTALGSRRQECFPVQTHQIFGK